MAVKEEVEALVTELYQCWYPSLLGYAVRSCGSVAMAEDVVQETLLALCRDLMKGVVIENPKGWTLAVLRHQISKRLEQEKDHGFTFEPLDIETMGQRQDPVLPILAADELSHLLSFLTRREEEVVLLRLEGLKYGEIAAQLGLHVSSVKTLVTRAIQKLQARVQGERQQGTALYVEPDAKTSRR